MELLQETRSRAEILARIGEITEIYAAAFLTVADESATSRVTDFPMEVIPHTVNGYQRFLSDQISQDQKGNITAGFIINLRAHLKLEFGKAILTGLQKELFSETPTEAPRQNAHDNSLSLWGLAYIQQTEASPPPEFDALVTYLFVQRLKWASIRAGLGQAGAAVMPAEIRKENK